MDGSQMGESYKKGLPLENKQGRPYHGALSTYPKELRTLIYKLREQHGGWGAISILLELQEEYGYSLSSLPSKDGVNRYLKQKGFISLKIRASSLPSNDCPISRFHDLWELDAQGTIFVKGIGYHSMINIKDSKSKAYCMSFPVSTKGRMSQPTTSSYFWALRLAFEEFGLPQSIQVDRDSVFIDSRSKSPFPSQIHLYLIGLGIEFCFINVAPPLKQSMVERSHQTIDGQVTKGQEYKTWQDLFRNTNKRRKVLNEKYPSRSLGGKAPLTAFPKAKHSGRFYSIEKEEELIELHRIYKYLSECCWYRKVSDVKTISLNAKIYYLKHAEAKTQIQINFCNRSKKLIFRNAKEQLIAKLPMKDFSKEKIMGLTTNKIVAMKKKLFRSKDFPISK